VTDPLLRLQDVTRSFGGIRALAGVTCEVRPGQIVGVIGPNGAGKTTIFNVITGAYRASSGEVRLSGEPITDRRPYRIARAGVIRTFQNIRLFSSMTVFEHLLVAQAARQSMVNRFVPVGWTGARSVERAERSLELFGLGPVRDLDAKSLPYGTQRRVEMARALSAEPRLLLLDEPVAGMSHQEADEIRDLLLRIRRSGVTILLIEHDMRFVMRLCDYLYVLDFGAVIAQGGPARIQADPAVLDAYLGAEA
jgi:branched-chain amino acid transport system ATP-binding protein